jgi:ABC-type multidrug transport system ATPase subunit
MSACAIETVGLTKRYGQKTAVADLTLQVTKGNCLALLGPNGAGKSTTVNMLIGLTRPSGGRIFINGRPFDGRDATVKACFGVLPEGFLLFEHLSLREIFLEKAFPGPVPAGAGAGELQWLA